MPRRRLKITPELQRFIEHLGGYFENSGVPRIGGLILGLLMIAHEPLSAEEIASLLKISRASISTNFRVLFGTGLADRYTSQADRMTYYFYPDTAWEQIMQMNVQRSMTFKRIIEEGLAAVSESDRSHQRLELAREYSDLIVDTYQKAAVEWRAQHGQPDRPRPKSEHG